MQSRFAAARPHKGRLTGCGKQAHHEGGVRACGRGGRSRPLATPIRPRALAVVVLRQPTPDGENPEECA
jgi:hypothetical protein